MGTGLKILNKIIKFSLVKNEAYEISLISRDPKDLLNLEETKKNI